MALSRCESGGPRHTIYPYRVAPILSICNSPCEKNNKQLHRHKKATLDEGRSGEYDKVTSVMLGCDRFTEEEALSHTLTYASTSYETTALAMQWAIVALSTFPKVHHRLCEEIRAHL